MSGENAENIVSLPFDQFNGELPKDDWEKLNGMSDEDLERAMSLGLLGPATDPRVRMARAIRVMRRQERQDVELTSIRIATEDLRDAAEEARNKVAEANRMVQIAAGIAGGAGTFAIICLGLVIFA